MKEAARISETSVNFYQTTWRNITQDSHLHTCSRENLKSQKTQRVSNYNVQNILRENLMQLMKYAPWYQSDQTATCVLQQRVWIN
jgi:hypothetical protein